MKNFLRRSWLRSRFVWRDKEGRKRVEFSFAASGGAVLVGIIVLLARPEVGARFLDVLDRLAKIR